MSLSRQFSSPLSDPRRFDLQTDGERDDLVMNAAAFGRQRQNRAAAVQRIDPTVDQSVIDRPRDRAADLYLVHGGAVADGVGRQRAEAGEHGHDAPFRYRQSEALFVKARQRPADEVGKHGQAIGQVFFQHERGRGRGRSSGRARPYRAFRSRGPRAQCSNRRDERSWENPLTRFHRQRVLGQNPLYPPP